MFSQSYKDHKVLTDINMTIQSGEFVVLIGSSGCGKTTLLKTINKLTSLAGGEILIDGVSIRDIPDIALRRRIGYVIQDGGLFPHLTVEENISLLLETVGMPSEKIPARVDEVLEMVNLDPDTFRTVFRHSSPADRKSVWSRPCLFCQSGYYPHGRTLFRPGPGDPGRAAE